jgi:hypothetical protein
MEVVRPLEDTAPVGANASSDVPTASEADPIFAVIEAHRNANLDWAAELKRNDADHPDCEAAGARESVAYEIFWRPCPRRLPELTAYFQYLQEPRWPFNPSIEPNADIPAAFPRFP